MDGPSIAPFVLDILTKNGKTVGHPFIGAFYGPNGSPPKKIFKNSTLILLSVERTHCVTLHVVDDDEAEFFDPVAFPPDYYGEDIQNFVARFKNVKYNPFPFQDAELSNVCFGYSAMFVFFKALGHSFEDILKIFCEPVLPDLKMCIELSKLPLLENRDVFCGVKEENIEFFVKANYKEKVEWKWIKNDAETKDRLEKEKKELEIVDWFSCVILLFGACNLLYRKTSDVFISAASNIKLEISHIPWISHIPLFGISAAKLLKKYLFIFMALSMILFSIILHPFLSNSQEILRILFDVWAYLERKRMYGINEVKATIGMYTN